METGNEWVSFLLLALVPAGFGMLLLAFVKGLRRGIPRHPLIRIGLGNFLVLGLLVSLILIGAEAYFRFVRDTTDSYNFTKASQRWFARHYHLNNFAMRDNVSYSIPVPPNKRRLTIVGDSFAAGHGVADVNKRFVNLIRANAPVLDVQLMGDIGYDTDKELALLQLAATNGYPLGTVLLVYVLNDISDLVPEWSAVITRIGSYWKNQNWLVRNSYLADTCFYRLKARQDPDIPGYFSFIRKAYEGPVWDTQARRLKELRDAVEQGGGRLVVVTFPFLHAIGPQYEWLPVHQKLGALWQDLGVPHLDLLTVYQSHRPVDLVVNRLDAHPNEFAHLVAADAILTFLKDNEKTGPNNRPSLSK